MREWEHLDDHVRRTILARYEYDGHAAPVLRRRPEPAPCTDRMHRWYRYIDRVDGAPTFQGMCAVLNEVMGHPPWEVKEPFIDVWNSMASAEFEERAALREAKEKKAKQDEEDKRARGPGPHGRVR